MMGYEREKKKKERESERKKKLLRDRIKITFRLYVNLLTIGLFL